MIPLDGGAFRLFFIIIFFFSFFFSFVFPRAGIGGFPIHLEGGIKTDFLLVLLAFLLARLWLCTGWTQVGNAVLTCSKTIEAARFGRHETVKYVRLRLVGKEDRGGILST